MIEERDLPMLDPPLTIVSTEFMERKSLEVESRCGKEKSEEQFRFLETEDDPLPAVVVVKTYANGNRVLFASFDLEDYNRYNVAMPVLPEGTPISPRYVIFTLYNLQKNHDIREQSRKNMLSGNVSVNLHPSEIN